MAEEDDEALARVIQQEMLEGGTRVRLHLENGEIVRSRFIPSGSGSVTFEAVDEDVGPVHFLSITVEGEEIWRGGGTGLPTVIPKGGKLVLNNMRELIRDAGLMRELEKTRQQLGKLGPVPITAPGTVGKSWKP